MGAICVLKVSTYKNTKFYPRYLNNFPFFVCAKFQVYCISMQKCILIIFEIAAMRYSLFCCVKTFIMYDPDTGPGTAYEPHSLYSKETQVPASVHSLAMCRLLFPLEILL